MHRGWIVAAYDLCSAVGRDVTFSDHSCPRFAFFRHPYISQPREVLPGCLMHRLPTMPNKMAEEKVMGGGAYSKYVIDHDMRVLAD